jgi:hypothetical protein
MYASGIPMGMITDRKSPRLAAIIGMFALGFGYFPIHTGMIPEHSVPSNADPIQRTKKELAP